MEAAACGREDQSATLDRSGAHDAHGGAGTEAHSDDSRGGACGAANTGIEFHEKECGTAQDEPTERRGADQNADAGDPAGISQAHEAGAFFAADSGDSRKELSVALVCGAKHPPRHVTGEAEQGKGQLTR